ncbi:serine/threonine-protein kinase [Limnoraphis robusta]|uniref:non-specific serine/threonine protein kinase n=1 Tax=Limnoraphis robusta CCNP1315 TaxID=3110306 RepID=A0ABU5U8K6_9CYAN|nr:serine/threonine-protein kinase [Limnoraphis robusta]MEA5522963.1 serine/threonine-protein kinase [Limnoraphis robusta CCNP1315]MEA5545006.1 serine/threonine-protein kinase [Limnoraphis robusta CCNP1324]
MSQCLNPDCLLNNQPNTLFCQRCGVKLLLAERYRSVEIIGQGGFGRTFKAIDEFKPSKPFCVIKQFFPQAQGTETVEKAKQLFEQEAVRLDELGKHPQIPELYAYFTQDKRQYLVQEYIQGKNLQQELDESGTFNETQILQLLKKLLPVLYFVHQNQVIHRDIKPENLIYRASDNQLFLVDFGAAKLATRTALAVTGTTIGSAGYAAPEQALGKANFSSDIYSLGVTCIHLLTQVEPFQLYDVSEGEWVWRDYLTNPINQKLGEVLDKMLQQAMKKRYQSVGEIVNAISSQAAPSKTVRIPPPPPPPTSLTKVIAAPPPPPPTQLIKVVSARGVDYTLLEYLLSQKQWEYADEETAKRLRDAAGNNHNLHRPDLEKLPCEDLGIINNLWMKYSDGRFSFSVQKQIYLDTGNKLGQYHRKAFEDFGDKVGWRQNKQWLSYNNLSNISFVPQGHFPLRECLWEGRFYAGRFGRLFSRVGNCNL